MSLYRRRFFFLLFVFTLGIPVVQLYAQDTGERMPFEQLQEKVEDIKTVLTQDPLFEPVESNFLNVGFRDQTQWLRIQIPPQITSGKLFLELEYPLLDSVTLYFRDRKTNRWVSKTSGDAVPFYQRDVAYRNMVFKIEPSKKEKTLCYFEVKTQGSLQFSYKLWTEDMLRKEMLDEQIIFGALFGIFFILSAYGLLISGFLRTQAYLYYSLMVLSAALFISVLNGYAYQYLWSNSPEWSNQALPFSVGVFTVSAINFTQIFLNTKKESVIIHYALNVCALIGGLIASFVFLDYYNILTRLVVSNASITAILIFYTSVMARAKGNHFTRFVVSGSYLFLIGILLAVLRSFGIVDTTFITKHGVELGTTMFMLLVAVSLNERYSVWRVRITSKPV